MYLFLARMRLATLVVLTLVACALSFYLFLFMLRDVLP